MSETEDTKKSDERCPNCGYCPHCGRSNAAPWVPAYRPYPTYPGIPYPTYPGIVYSTYTYDHGSDTITENTSSGPHSVGHP